MSKRKASWCSVVLIFISAFWFQRHLSNLINWLYQEDFLTDLTGRKQIGSEEGVVEDVFCYSAQKHILTYWEKKEIGFAIDSNTDTSRLRQNSWIALVWRVGKKPRRWAFHSPLMCREKAQRHNLLRRERRAVGPCPHPGKHGQGSGGCSHVPGMSLCSLSSESSLVMCGAFCLQLGATCALRVKK